MQDRPNIKTALPRRRYQLGSHAATLLGDVESGDGRSYRYILALVPAGASTPVLYVTCEPVPPARAGDGRYDLRLVSEALSEVMDSADRWGDLDSFAEQALDLAGQVLGLGNETPIRLM